MTAWDEPGAEQAVFETKAHLDLLVASGRLEHPVGAPVLI